MIYQTKRTDLWCKSGGSTDFTSRRPEVDDLDFTRILKRNLSIIYGRYFLNISYEFGGHGEC